MDRAFPQIHGQYKTLRSQQQRRTLPDAVIKHHSNASGGKKIYTLEIKPTPVKRRKTTIGSQVPRIGISPENREAIQKNSSSNNNNNNTALAQPPPLHSVPPSLQSLRPATRSNNNNETLGNRNQNSIAENSSTNSSSSRILQAPSPILNTPQQLPPPPNLTRMPNLKRRITRSISSKDADNDSLNKNDTSSSTLDQSFPFVFGFKQHAFPRRVPQINQNPIGMYSLRRNSNNSRASSGVSTRRSNSVLSNHILVDESSRSSITSDGSSDSSMREVCNRHLHNTQYVCINSFHLQSYQR